MALVWNGRCTSCAQKAITHTVIAGHTKFGVGGYGSGILDSTDTWDAVYGITLPTLSDADLHRRFAVSRSYSSLTLRQADIRIDPMTGVVSESDVLDHVTTVQDWAAANSFLLPSVAPTSANAVISSLTSATSTHTYIGVDEALVVRRKYYYTPPANPPYDKSMQDPDDWPDGVIYWSSTDEQEITSVLTFSLLDEVTDSYVQGVVDGLVDTIDWDALPEDESYAGYIYYGPSDEDADPDDPDSDWHTPAVKTKLSAHGNFTTSVEPREDYALCLGYSRSMQGPRNVATVYGDIKSPQWNEISGSLAYPGFGAFPFFSRTIGRIKCPAEWHVQPVKRDTLSLYAAQGLFAPWNGWATIQQAAGGFAGYEVTGDCTDQFGDGIACTYAWRDMVSPTWDTPINLWNVYVFDRDCNDDTDLALRF